MTRFFDLVDDENLRSHIVEAVIPVYCRFVIVQLQSPFQDSRSLTMTTYPAAPVLRSCSKFACLQAPTPTAQWDIDDVKKCEINEDTLPALIEQCKQSGTRWLLDIVPQIPRAIQNHKRKAMLCLTMCALKNASTGDLETPSCRTEAMIAALEYGVSVIHFNLRTDCIRHASTSKGVAQCMSRCL